MSISITFAPDNSIAAINCDEGVPASKLIELLEELIRDPVAFQSPADRTTEAVTEVEIELNDSPAAPDGEGFTATYTATVEYDGEEVEEHNITPETARENLYDLIAREPRFGDISIEFH
jgi:hypothetical protein